MKSFEKFSTKLVGMKKNQEGKKNFFDKVRDNKGLKIMALVFTLLLSTETMRAGNDDNKNKENLKNKVEDARMMLNKINKYNKEKDLQEKADFKEETLNGINVKSYDYSNGEKMIVSDDKTFVLVSVDNKMFYDRDADGIVDRVVINKTENESKDVKSLVNVAHCFEDIETLAEEASVISMSKMDKSLIANIDGSKVEMVNLGDGSVGYVDGDKAKEMTNQIQSLYNDQLENIIESIEK